jgi:predicted RNA methylase
VKTTSKFDLRAVGLDHPDRVNDEPGGWLDLWRTLPADSIGRSDVPGLGAGKGRTVLMASRHPFARVIGVEVSKALTAVARRNVAACRLRRRCGRIELITADARLARRGRRSYVPLPAG